MATRRDFIRSGASGMVGMSMLPVFEKINLWQTHMPVYLPRATPESQGISSQAILDFIKEANASGYWHSFMLVRHGHVVAEGWWKPFEPQFKHTLYSLSKSFTSTAVGLAIQEGKLKVDDPVISFFQNELPEQVEENLKLMKVKHLLTMNTGHAEDTLPKLREAGKDWTRTFLKQPVKFEPGTHFLYNTGATYMLGAIVYKVTGEKLEDYLRPRLFQPLGIEGYDWEKSPDGLNTAGYGLRVKTEDIARFGQLYLQKGKWNDKQILDAAWVDEATRYQTKSNEGDGDWSQGYGYQFWRCKPGFYRGDGAFGQFCFVMPDQDVVLAVTSESFNMQKSMTIVWETILPGIKNAAITDDKTTLTSLKNELKKLSLPVIKGSVSSKLSSKYSGKKFRLETNDFNASETGFQFSKDSCTWKATVADKKTGIKFGWEKWLINEGDLSYPFLPGRASIVASKFAGTATWINDNTLQLNLRFVDAIHGDKITCVFEGDTVKITFLNSVSENSKGVVDSRPVLSGVIGK